MSRRDFPAGYVALTALIPDSVRVLDAEEFRGTGEADADTGDRWIASGESAVLQVHSSVVPREHVYLLNPAHRDCDRIQIEKIEPFVFDARLLGPR